MESIITDKDGKIASAFKTAWPCCRVINCCGHLVKNFTSKLYNAEATLTTDQHSKKKKPGLLSMYPQLSTIPSEPFQLIFKNLYNLGLLPHWKKHLVWLLWKEVVDIQTEVQITIKHYSGDHSLCSPHEKPPTYKPVTDEAQKKFMEKLWNGVAKDWANYSHGKTTNIAEASNRYNSAEKGSFVVCTDFFSYSQIY